MLGSSIISTSVLKGKAIYGDLLLKQGYQRYQVDDLAITEFLDYERNQLGESSNLYLLAIKKILLYATPIIAPPNSSSKRGVALTAQFTTDCIINNVSKDQLRLTTGDKYILLGFTFPQNLINHLDFSAFEWKYYQLYPKEYSPSALNISYLDGIETILQSKRDSLFIIKTTHYEDADLYNQILRLLKLKLNEYNYMRIVILDQVNKARRGEVILFAEPPRVAPLNDTPIVQRLNALLEKQIDPTYTASYYETLHITANWLLYNLIFLYGYDSPAVSKYLTRLVYVKNENAKVLIQLVAEAQVRLAHTRSEKIAREQYPFYFSSIDRRGIFSKFSRFDLTKLPKAHQQEINILAQKELAHQEALIHNQCPHMAIIQQLTTSQSITSTLLQAYSELKPYINFERKVAEDHIYHCKNCEYELLCEHEVDFYSELQLNKEDSTITDNDIFYTAQQIIVNRYKQTQISMDHSDVFSYHCRYCAKELGKSDDIIQVGRKDIVYGQQITIEHDLFKNWVYLTLSGVLNINVDPLVLGIDKRRTIRALMPIIKEHLEIISYTFKKLDNEELIENHNKLATLIVCLCSLISLNINVLKTNKQLLIEYPKSKGKSGKEFIDETSEPSEPTIIDESSNEELLTKEPSATGGSIKTEFTAAFSIIKRSIAYKLVNMSDDKLKAMLMDYYRRIAKDIGDTVDVSAVINTNEVRLTKEIIQSPVYAYLQYILARNERKVIQKHSHTFKQVIGLEIVKGFMGNIYENIVIDKIKPSNDRAKYINESYNTLRSFLTSIKYRSTDIESDLSQFVQQYELTERKRIEHLIYNPRYILAEINAREISFVLTNLNLIYCNDQTTPTKHKWIKGKCSICGIAINKTSPSYNNSINKLIEDASAKTALFDLYTNSCPVKDIHIYADVQVGLQSKCIQCGATKKQLLDQDPTYYKQHLSQFNTYHQTQISAVEAEVKSLMILEPYVEAQPQLLKPKDPSELIAQNNQMLVIIEKSLDGPSNSLGELDMMYIDSYIRLVYERYTYASNLSYDMTKHPDIEFYSFIRDNFFKNAKPIRVYMPPLPEYDYRDYDSLTKQHHLILLLWTIAQDSTEAVVELGKYIVRKIAAQEARRKDFNFAKLKSIVSVVEDADVDVIENFDDLEEEENESDMFMTYDIDMDDMEDNMNGETD